MKLTDAQRADRLLTGGDLQRQICDLAEILGWSWVHFRPAKTQRGWRVPVEGPLGAGWPDLILARDRVLAVEVKRELGDQPTPVQTWVHDVLRRAGVDVAVWRPSDMTNGVIQEALR